MPYIPTLVWFTHDLVPFAKGHVVANGGGKKRKGREVEMDESKCSAWEEKWKWTTQDRRRHLMRVCYASWIETAPTCLSPAPPRPGTRHFQSNGKTYTKHKMLGVHV